MFKAPGFSLEMLKEKTFGRFESDEEFRLVHFASMPLYSESFDANAALKSCLVNTYNAESHSKPTTASRSRTSLILLADDLYSAQEKYFDYREQLHRITANTLVIVGEKDWICPSRASLMSRQANVDADSVHRQLGIHRIQDTGGEFAGGGGRKPQRPSREERAGAAEDTETSGGVGGCKGLGCVCIGESLVSVGCTRVCRPSHCSIPVQICALYTRAGGAPSCWVTVGGRKTFCRP
jgi:hypothetical protein